MADFGLRIACEEFWSSVGYWTLVAGLVGDILVLVVPRHRERLEKILTAFFTIVIIIGVAIEHRADAAISVLVSQEQDAVGLQISQLQTGNLQLQGNLTTATAELRSKEAALARQQEETAKAQKELAVAQLALDRQVRTQGPRWLWLKDIPSSLSQELRQFSGQRVDVVVCGKSRPLDNEQYHTAGTVADILGPRGAKWDVNWHLDELCTRSPSVEVFVNSMAQEKTRNAASAVCKGLHALFPDFPVAPYLMDPKLAPHFAMWPESALMISASNPDSVVIDIGSHP
jgi:hypothetical protein